LTPWEKVEEFHCGKWVENSVEETSKAMNEVLANDREEMRANSKRLAYKFGWENIALDFKNLYESMTEKSHG
jgi:glycosyltransferase involved in cell wall biosynthesis